MFALWGTSLVGGRLSPMTMPIVLPWPLQSSLEAAARALLQPSDRSHIDFSRPTGEAALVSPDSVCWRVFKNPLSLFIGGLAASAMGPVSRSHGTRRWPWRVRTAPHRCPWRVSAHPEWFEPGWRADGLYGSSRRMRRPEGIGRLDR